MARVPGAAGQRARSIASLTGQGLDVHAGALWCLVGIEMLALVILRRYFRKHHGG